MDQRERLLARRVPTPAQERAAIADSLGIVVTDPQVDRPHPGLDVTVRCDRCGHMLGVLKKTRTGQMMLNGARSPRVSVRQGQSGWSVACRHRDGTRYRKQVSTDAARRAYQAAVAASGAPVGLRQLAAS